MEKWLDVIFFLSRLGKHDLLYSDTDYYSEDVRDQPGLSFLFFPGFFHFHDWKKTLPLRFNNLARPSWYFYFYINFQKWNPALLSKIFFIISSTTFYFRVYLLQKHQFSFRSIFVFFLSLFMACDHFLKSLIELFLFVFFFPSLKFIMKP